MKTSPFTILALAPFGRISGDGPSSKPVAMNMTSLGEGVENLASTLSIPAPKELCPSGAVSFNPSRIKDFRPSALVHTIPYLKSLSDAAEMIEQAVSEGLQAEEIARRVRSRWPELPLDLSISQDTPRLRENSAVDDILSMVAMTGKAGAGLTPGAGGPGNWKEQIDSVLASLLEKIFADEGFRSMEAAWRGLETAVKQGPVQEGERVVLKAASISGDTLNVVLDNLTRELGDEPPNLILIDFPFDNTPPSIELLEKVADFASTLLAPTAVWIGPRFFHLESWKEFSKLGYLNHHLEDAAYAKWRKLKEHPGGDWLVMTANRFLIRGTYGEANPPRPVPFSEHDPPWVSPVWALGTLVAKSVMIHGWPARFTDYRTISLGDLAVVAFGDEGPAATEAFFSEDRISQFIEAGITPLAGAIRKDTAFMPRETTLSGNSLKFQLFFNRIVGFLFGLKEEMGDAAYQSDLGTQLSSALSELFRGTGHEPPADLSIHAEAAEPGKPIPLRIAFTPPGSILPTSERLEFSLAW
jgi:hypothetical protein